MIQVPAQVWETLLAETAPDTNEDEYGDEMPPPLHSIPHLFAPYDPLGGFGAELICGHNGCGASHENQVHS